MTSRWIIGLASGSTADSVDAALFEVEGSGLEIRVQAISSLQLPHPQDLRELILRLGSAKPCEIKQVSMLHRLLGETFAAAARQIADRSSFSLQRIQCIGCPGHTIWHEPEGRFPSTLIIGMPAIVAERTGVTTVSDFRSRDMAAGGQGIPSAALADYLLFRDPEESRLLIHLGGIARVIYLPFGSRVNDIVGYEAGPCNLLLDGLIRQVTGGREAFDPGGKHAVQGCCIDELLKRWLSHGFLQRRPPKSMPRQGFGENFIVQALQMARDRNWQLHDLLCTATHFVANGIVDSFRRFLPSGWQKSRIFLSGGGVRNGLLLRLLEQQLPGNRLDSISALGITADARKPLCFGILAALTLDGVPANVPSATGAAGARMLGSITPGSVANWARGLAWMAAQTSPLAATHDQAS